MSSECNGDTPACVVHVIPKFSQACWGGAETVIMRIVELARDSGGLHAVWTTDSFGRRGDDTVSGIPVRRFRGAYFNRGERAQAGIGRAPVAPGMLLAVGRLAPGTVVHMHCHNRLSSLVAVACRVRRLPYILTIHGELRRMVPRWRYAFATEYAIRHASAVTCVQPSTVERVRSVGSSGTVVSIPNGVDRAVLGSGNRSRGRERMGVPLGVPLVMISGRICELKNQLVALRVIADLHNRCGDGSPHLAIVGPASEPDYIHTLDAEVLELGLEGLVHTAGPFDPKSLELADAYAAADLVMVPSRFEAFPLVVLDAWAAGRPVVATRVGGLAEVVEHRSNGYLVDYADSTVARDLADAVDEILSTDELRSVLVAGGSASVAAYAWEHIVGAYNEVYESARCAR